jgi:hypothetical protein
MDIVEWSEGIGMIAIGEVGGETNAIVTVFFGSSEKRGWGEEQGGTNPLDGGID